MKVKRMRRTGNSGETRRQENGDEEEQEMEKKARVRIKHEMPCVTEEQHLRDGNLMRKYRQHGWQHDVHATGSRQAN